MFILGKNGHEPHELVVIHVRYMGIYHSNIDVVYFNKYRFKGVLFYEEVLLKLSNDASIQELQAEKDEMKKFHQDQFQRFL